MRNYYSKFLSVLLLGVPVVMTAQDKEWKWAMSSQNASLADISSLSADMDGNVYAGGNFSSQTVTFGNHTITNSGFGTNFFIAKYGTEGDIQWISKASSLQCILHSTVTDAEGNVYGVGHFFHDIVLGDLVLATSSSWSMVIFKLDTDGNFVWARSVGESQRVNASKIVMDSNGNLCVAGYFTCPTVTFDDITLTLSGPQDIFLAKYDTHGNILWAKRAGGTSGESANTLTVDQSDNIYIAGNFSGSVTFGDSIITSLGSADIFLAKYDGEGNAIWGRAGGGSAYDTVSNLYADSEGNVIMAGDFYYAITLGDTTLEHSGSIDSADVFLAKYSGDGNVLWTKLITGNGHDSCGGLVVTPEGNILLTGSSLSASLNLDGTLLPNSGYRQIYIAEFDGDGVLGWAEQTSGAGDSRSLGIVVDSNQDIYISGRYNAALPFGETTLDESGSNAFIAKYGSVLLGNNGFDKRELTVYPNPAKDRVSFETDLIFDNWDYAIYDMTGKIVLRGKIESNIISVTDLPAGLYVLSAGNSITRFIKE